MRTITTYSWDELTHGSCTCCGQISDEIVKTDGRRVDCIEDEKLFELSFYGECNDEDNENNS